MTAVTPLPVLKIWSFEEEIVGEGSACEEI